jgi:hypothetical protein
MIHCASFVMLIDPLLRAARAAIAVPDETIIQMLGTPGVGQQEGPKAETVYIVAIIVMAPENISSFLYFQF